MILAEVGALKITRKNIKKIPSKPYFSAYKGAPMHYTPIKILKK